MRQAVVIDAVRTPIGRAHPEKGIYRDVRADDLSADLMCALLERASVPASAIEDIQWGCVKQQGEQGYDVARMAALIAGLPIEVGGVTVNRNCGSSLQAINSAAQSIAANAEDVHIAGGVEHMHHIPMEAGFDASPRLWYRHSPATMNMGLTAENLAIRYKIGRREQDEWALRSHQRAARATDSGAFAKEIIPTWGRDEEGRRKVLIEDQCIRRDTSLEALAALKPAFMPEGGTVTAGNSSPLTDGAAAVLLMSEEKARALGKKPLAAFRSWAYVGVDPADQLLIGPALAIPKALERAEMPLSEVDLVDLHEAFAAQVLCVTKALASRGFARTRLGRDEPVGEIDPAILNVHGGSIALGHPFGATGARMVTTMANELSLTGKQTALLGICAAGGLGAAAVLERAD
jgi:acetyl-CoA acyltransferase